MKILITGATGLLGKEVGKALIEKGHKIVVVSRDPQKAIEQLPFPCEVIAGDLGIKNLQGEPLLREIDAVIHLMGESVGGGRWTEERKRRIYESRVLGTRHLIESLSVAPKVFISASGAGYYGSAGSDILNEESAPGDDFLAKTCVNWEKELLPLTVGKTGTRVVRLRTGMVFATQGGALDKLFPLFRRGLGSVIAGGQQWMNWIHIQDVVGLIFHALENSSVDGAMNLVSPNPATNEHFTKALASAMGVSVGPPAPAFAIKAALGEMSVLVLASQRVIPEVALRTGYKFKHPDLQEALRDVALPLSKGEEFFYSEQYLPWTPQEIFPFFSAAKNLEKITPPILSFKILEEPKETLGTGSEIRYKISVHGLPMEWLTLIKDWEPPFKFVDTQVKGPYKLWHHTHEFKAFAGGTLMTDKVRYKLPMGFLGNFVAGGFVRGDVEKIFAYRRQYLAKNLARELGI
ncbi:MAG: TIGR01777 family protein [Bdellovibrionaceae bacterium]|nr:TIGR01777 family protein [Pseudobdellovibrionaceae bacterium]